ncbi:RNA 2'-phosphotransferase [Moraxella lacunata]|uniref:Probable RNA 2'-phosphotransferase n=1 Tax=Moraxella lacunata TaxID=477 RepID=A0A378T5T5_MORLA|nr:RNA 2'-phosphotransferase [Moraxella lacunata]STZ56182.1 RNA 2'-phosphotransferase [Moraxella lacunata]
MQTDEKIAKKISKFLSLILRHKPEIVKVTLDKQGFTNIDVLLNHINKFGNLPFLITREAIDEVVANNDKKRFEFSADGTQIRAVQGHSTPMVDRDYPIKTPPNPLYHGTARQFLPNIAKEGLIGKTRHLVHLSESLETAKKVGARHGKVRLLKIDTEKMLKDGFVFYQAENGVWLTKTVPSQYLTTFDGQTLDALLDDKFKN